MKKIKITNLKTVCAGCLVFSVFVAQGFAQEDAYYSTVERTLNNYEQNQPAESYENIPPPETVPLTTSETHALGQSSESSNYPSGQDDLQNVSQPESKVIINKITAVPGLPDQKSKESIVIDVLELKDMEIADVLKLISKKSGLNIVAGKNVKGKITIYLKNVEVRDALRIILESNDMAYAEEDGIIKVMGAKDYELAY